MEQPTVRCLALVITLYAQSVGTSNLAHVVELVTLLPLSGPDTSRGQASKLGVELAMEDFIRTHNLTELPFNLTFHDSQCNTSVEDQIILQQLTTTSRKLVALGGECISGQTTGTDYALASMEVSREFVPQITFEDGFPASGVSLNYANVAPSISASHVAVGDFLIQHDWNQVAIIRQNSTRHLWGSVALKNDLSRRNVTTDLILEMALANRDAVLQESGLRVVFLHADLREAISVICTMSKFDATGSRYVWLLPGQPLSSVGDVFGSEGELPCVLQPVFSIYYFSIELSPEYIQSIQTFGERLSPVYPTVHTPLHEAVALAYDAATLSFSILWWMDVSLMQEPYELFASTFASRIRQSRITGATGLILLDSADGNRQVRRSVYRIQGEQFVEYGASDMRSMGPDVVASVVDYDVIPFPVFVVMCSLALIGIVYALVIIGFNLYYRNDRMIKMTSPNINVVMLMGALLGYVSMALLGLDEYIVELTVVETSLQVCQFFIVIGFTLIYGSLLTKTWRVYLIFKNLNVNGKTTRDEHLLMGVFSLLVMDIVLLLSWTFIHPLRCYQQDFYTVFHEGRMTDVVYRGTYCHTEFQALWISLLYILKLPVIIVGGFLTFQVRHVTLPALKDTTEVYVVIYAVLSTSVIGLPLLLTSGVAMTTRYMVGALLLFVVLTATITLLFTPKIYAVRKCKESSLSNAAIKFLFSESLKRTQENATKCSLCCCLLATDEDRYAQEVLATEIETLTKTIKEKDATIRELTDRLYFSAGRFHEYDMGSKQSKSRRVTSQPACQTTWNNGLDRCRSERGPYHGEKTHDENNLDASCPSTIELSVKNLPGDALQSPVQSHSKHRRSATIHTTTNSRIHYIYTDGCLENSSSQEKLQRGPSPNIDSAIDNNSPSSASNSDIGSINAEPDGSEFQQRFERMMEQNTFNSRRRWDPSRNIPLHNAGETGYPSGWGHHHSPDVGVALTDI